LAPHAHLDGVHELLLSLEGAFGAFVGSNSYFTPRKTQGFAPHYDDIEAFLMQLEGRKHWRVYAPISAGRTLPRYSSADFAQNELGRPVIEAVLGPGDLLYIPRGWPHQGVALDDADSLHLTVSTALHNTWYDLLELMLPQVLASSAASDLAFRSSLPTNLRDIAGVVNEDNEATQIQGSHTASLDRATFRTRVAGLLSRVMESAMESLDAGVDQMIRKNLRGRMPPRGRVPHQGCDEEAARDAAIARTTKKARARGAQVRLIRHDAAVLAVEDGEVKIYHYAGNTSRYTEAHEGCVELPLAAALACEKLIKAYPGWTRVTDLPSDGEDKRDVQLWIERLASAGVLQVS
jgi:lysine-specific demethylase/histidyl-hydroxylase NO66